MASAQEPGIVRIYRKSPNGSSTPIFQGSVSQTAPAGGCADGAQASIVTPEKQISVNSNVVLQNDDILLVTFEPDSADGLDASDCNWIVPLIIPSGSITLNRNSFQNPAFADQTLVANREVVIAGYKVTETQARLGGKLYMDMQDDTT